MKQPSATALNDALKWLQARQQESSDGQVVFAGLWQEPWKKDFKPGPHPRTKVVLALYEDAAADALPMLDHLGLYCEVTCEPAEVARNRLFAAGFKDVTVAADEQQCYVLARKSGRN